MVSRSMSALVLSVSLAFAGCKSSDVSDIVASMMDSDYHSSTPAPAREETRYEPVAAKPEVPVAEKGTRFIVGAWALDGRVDGKADGAPSSHGMDAEAIPGFSFEAQFLSRKEGEDTWFSGGFLFEHFRNAEDKSVSGGKARTEGALSSAWIVAGVAGDAVRKEEKVPTDFGWRVDGLLGLRRGFVQAEVPTGFGGTYRGSQTWGEVALGLRAEWSPVRRVFLFARVDAGGEIGTGSSAEDDTRGDSSIGSLSRQFIAGVRVRPVDHLSILFGWRYLYLDGNEFTNGGEDEIGRARATWSGPWMGIELDF